MKVLNKVKENYPKKIECECGAELEYDKEDMHIGALGYYHITCPVCEEEILLDEEEVIELNENNLRFPTNYFDYKNGNEIEKVDLWVRECIIHLKNNPNKNYVFTGSGNTMVFVLKYSEGKEYYVHVSKREYETYVPM